jgi:hypothetical protein
MSEKKYEENSFFFVVHEKYAVKRIDHDGLTWLGNKNIMIYSVYNRE